MDLQVPQNFYCSILDTQRENFLLEYFVGVQKLAREKRIRKDSLLVRARVFLVLQYLILGYWFIAVDRNVRVGVLDAGESDQEVMSK